METRFMLSLHVGVEVAEWSGKPDNDNLRLCPDWMTPAELLQRVRREKALMQKELAADFQLRSDPKHRLDLENLEALERCTLQHCYSEL